MSSTTPLTSYAENVNALLMAFGITAPALLVAVIFVWACFKTGSSRLVRARIWKLIAPAHEHSSARIKQFVAEADDLTHLHLVHGIKLRTKSSYERLVTWTEANGEGLQDVSECGIFFDTEAMGPSVKSPKSWVSSLLGAILILLLWATMAVVTFGMVAGGVTTINDSGHSYVLSNVSMNAFHGPRQGDGARLCLTAWGRQSA